MNDKIFDEYNINSQEINSSFKNEYNQTDLQNDEKKLSKNLKLKQFENVSNTKNSQKNDINLRKNNKKTQKNASTKTNFFKIVSTFMFACAMIVIVQPSINLPVFSQIFSPNAVASSKTYISSVDINIKTDKSNKYLYVKVNKYKYFTNFNSVYIQIENLTKDYKDYSIIPKKYLSTSEALFTFSLSKPSELFTLKIYCSTTDKEIKKNESITKDEITYYLIYEHDSYINF